MRSGTVVTIAFLAAVLAADVARGATFHWGPRIGVSHAALVGDHARTSPDPARIAPSVGLATQLDFSSWLVGRAELNYAQKGTGFIGQAVVMPAMFAPAPPGGSWNLDYLDVPVMLRARARHPSGHRYYLEAGPAVGIALAGRHGVDRVRDDMKLLDWGFATGVGLEFGHDAQRVGIEGRFARGFSNLWRNASHAPAIHESWTVSMVFIR